MSRRKMSAMRVSVVGLFPLLVLLSCQAKVLHPTFHFVAPDYASYSIKRIHVLPVVLTGLEGRERMAGESSNPEIGKDPYLIVTDLLERGLKNRAKYFFVMPEEGSSLAAKNNVSGDYKNLVAQWKRDLMIDSDKVVKVGSSMNVDAFLCPEIFLWRSVKVDPGLSEGYSYSDVGVRLYLFEVKKGEILCKIADENSLKSSFFTKSSAFQTPPDPPEMETVARLVVDVVLDSMP